MNLEAQIEGLRRFLRTDFSTFGDPTNRDLVIQRELSLENLHLGQQVQSFLEGAYISEMGQTVIVARTRQAHAEMSRIPSEISPSALGLDGNGLGIYDPDLAPDLEARLYRASLFREIQGLLTVYNWADDQVLTIESPGSFSISIMVETFTMWSRDFIETHGKEPMDYAKLNLIALARSSLLGLIIQQAVQHLGDDRGPADPQFSNN